jgi:hypothetical protein
MFYGCVKRQPYADYFLAFFLATFFLATFFFAAFFTFFAMTDSPFMRIPLLPAVGVAIYRYGLLRQALRAAAPPVSSWRANLL